MVSGVVALLAAPVLGVVGIFVGYALNARREDRSIRRDLSLQRYREGQQLFDELISAAGKRFVALQRWLWAVEQPAAYSAVRVRDEYFALVQQWNASTWSFRARLRLILGDETAIRFMDYSDDARSEPESLHYQFVFAHRAVLRAEAGANSIDDTQARIDRLNHAWSNFADDIAVDLAHRARSVQLLIEPSSRTETSA